MLPVGRFGHGIERYFAQIGGHQLVEVAWVLLLVGVEAVDGLAHLIEVVAQRRLARLLLRVPDVGYGDGRQDADDRDDDEQLDECEAMLPVAFWLLIHIHGLFRSSSPFSVLRSRFPAFST